MYVYVVTLRYSVEDSDPLIRVAATPEIAHEVAKDWLFTYFSHDDDFVELAEKLDETYADDKERFWCGEIVDVSKVRVMR